MKKLLLGALLLLSSFTCFAQDTFVKKYTSMVIKENGILQPWQTAEVTVVFNPNGVRDIVIYFSNGNKRTLHQVGDVTQGKTKNNEGYQIVKCIDEDGTNVAAQLFDDDTCFRIIIGDGYYVEFHND
jgi:hypothetical protein